MDELRTDDRGYLAVPDAYRSAWEEYVDEDADAEYDNDVDYDHVYEDEE